MSCCPRGKQGNKGPKGPQGPDGPDSIIGASATVTWQQVAPITTPVAMTNINVLDTLYNALETVSFVGTPSSFIGPSAGTPSLTFTGPVGGVIEISLNIGVGRAAGTDPINVAATVTQTASLISTTTALTMDPSWAADGTNKLTNRMILTCGPGETIFPTLFGDSATTLADIGIFSMEMTAMVIG